MNGLGAVSGSAGFLAQTGTFFSTTLPLFICMNLKDVKESKYLWLLSRDRQQVKSSNREAESSTSFPSAEWDRFRDKTENCSPFKLQWNEVG